MSSLFREKTDRQASELSAPRRVLDELTIAQHLHPHAAIHELLENVSHRLGRRPRSGAVMASLNLDPTTSAGRLSRDQIKQLACKLEGEAERWPADALAAAPAA